MVNQQEFCIFWYKNVAGQKHCNTVANNSPTKVWDNRRKAQSNTKSGLLERDTEFGRADLFIASKEAKCKLENKFGIYILTTWTATVLTVTSTFRTYMNIALAEPWTYYLWVVLGRMENVKYLMHL